MCPNFEVLFLESAETPLFAQINILAIWARWLELKFPSLRGVAVMTETAMTTETIKTATVAIVP